MIDYQTIEKFKPGLIQSLLKISYAGFIECFPDEKEKFYTQWEQEDHFAFNNPLTIGKYVLFTCINNLPIGYCSWDDRQNPVGIIGQNCILPQYQQRGSGRIQIEIIIKMFRDKNFREIRVITGEHDFFLPAQKMYQKCGFQERRRINGDMFNRIEFYKLI